MKKHKKISIGVLDTSKMASKPKTRRDIVLSLADEGEGHIIQWHYTIKLDLNLGDKTLETSELVLLNWRCQSSCRAMTLSLSHPLHHSPQRRGQRHWEALQKAEIGTIVCAK